MTGDSARFARITHPATTNARLINNDRMRRILGHLQAERTPQASYFESALLYENRLHIRAEIDQPEAACARLRCRRWYFVRQNLKLLRQTARECRLMSKPNAIPE
jgi:hypothetical protein